MGDVKLLGALGLFLGPFVLMSLFIGSLIGVVAGVVAGRGQKLADRRIPFGPWLAAGGVITALAGRGVLAWYLGIVGIG
jgi:prepilin signal peptidase PulO-like enzyme (type II secretory pathway)